MHTDDDAKGDAQGPQHSFRCGEREARTRQKLDKLPVAEEQADLARGALETV